MTTTTTRPILRSQKGDRPPEPRLYVFPLVSFKKNAHDTKLPVYAQSIAEAWEIARSRCWGHCYYLKPPQVFPKQKSSPPTGLLPKLKPRKY